MAIRALAVKRGRIQRLEMEVSNVATSEGFAEDPHKDQRWEGGLIGAEQAKLAVRYAKEKVYRERRKR
jgi:hypothetical protein